MSIVPSASQPRVMPHSRRHASSPPLPRAEREKLPGRGSVRPDRIRRLDIPPSRACLLVAGLLASLPGCITKKHLDAAQLEADQNKLQFLNAHQQAKRGQAELERVTAQRDRLAAENTELKRQLASLGELEKQRATMPSEADIRARAETDALRKELKQALTDIRLSRQQWEEDIAARQRTIDLLTSEIERLKRAPPSPNDPTSSTRPP